MKKKNLELYMHIPFCVKKCAYCDFLSAPACADEIHSYAQALAREIEEEGRSHGDYRVSTVFIGGGTPSLLSADDMTRLFYVLGESFYVDGVAEITLEVNPGTVSREKAAAWKKCGVNRLSIGLQSADDRELKLLGRIHTFSEFKNTWDIVRNTGFNNINIDLISAVPGQTAADWERSLRTAAELDPEHISAYSLIIEEGTLFYDWYREGGKRPRMVPELPDEDEERKIYKSTAAILKDYGYHRYEISNYAKQGYECRHNLGYWERKEYLGLGLGSASLIGECRFRNTPDMRKYMKIYGGEDQIKAERQNIEGCRAGLLTGPAAEEIEVLTDEDKMEEFMFLGLRKTEGIRREDFESVFGKNINSVYGKTITDLERLGLLECTRTGIRLTERGTDISNYVFSEFIL